MALAELHLSTSPDGVMALKEAFEAVPVGRWDLVVLDCPPSLGAICLAALNAAHGVIVPLPLQAMPLDGLAQLLETIERVQKRTNPGLKLSAIFGTNSNSRTALANDVRADLESNLPNVVLKREVRINTSLAEAYGARKPIIHYAPASNGAADYRAIAEELLERGAA